MGGGVLLPRGGSPGGSQAWPRAGQRAAGGAAICPPTRQAQVGPGELGSSLREPTCRRGQRAQPLTRRELLIMSRSLGCPARAGQRVKGRGQGSESKQQRNQSRVEREVIVSGFRGGEQQGRAPTAGVWAWRRTRGPGRREPRRGRTGLWERPGGRKADRGPGEAGGAAAGARAAGARTRLSPESTSSREMRLWPSRRSSYRSLMCLWACGTGAESATGSPAPPTGPGGRGMDPRGRRQGAHRACPLRVQRHLPLPSSATGQVRRDQESPEERGGEGGGGGRRQEERERKPQVGDER